LIGHLAGTTKELANSCSFVDRMILHASELKNDFAQSKQEGFNSEAIKNSFQGNGTGLKVELPGESKIFAQSL
jgi:hypothetical protein